MEKINATIDDVFIVIASIAIVSILTFHLLNTRRIVYKMIINKFKQGRFFCVVMDSFVVASGIMCLYRLLN